MFPYLQVNRYQASVPDDLDSDMDSIHIRVEKNRINIKFNEACRFYQEKAIEPPEIAPGWTTEKYL